MRGARAGLPRMCLEPTSVPARARRAYREVGLHGGARTAPYRPVAFAITVVGRVETSTASGLVLATRSAFPRNGGDEVADATPEITSVGPEANPGDPNGVEVIGGTPDGGWPPIIRPRAQPWDGWPSEWRTPNWWGVVEPLTDTAWACIDLNASLMATMPAYLVGAAEGLPRDWLVNPNPLVYSSWAEFAKQLFWDYQLGEAFVLATAYYANGYPARFHVVPPWAVTVEVDAGGVRSYRIGNVDVTADMLHIRYQGHVGDAHGHGPLEVGAGRLIAANAIARYATNLVASGGVPHSVLTHPARLTAEQAAKLCYQWADARAAAMGLTAVLSGGLEFKSIAIDPEKMALVDLSRWNESRIAVLLRVPPFLVGLPSGGDSLTYSNVTSLFTYHWRAGLSTFAVPVMQALTGWLLPRGTSLELNRDEYVKADPLERAQTWEILHGIADETGAVLSVEEIRELERFGLAAPSESLSSGVLQ